MCSQNGASKEMRRAGRNKRKNNTLRSECCKDVQMEGWKHVRVEMIQVWNNIDKRNEVNSNLI